MVEKIKSKYIIKKIFEILEEKIKLKIISYNKQLQEKCGITLIDYKRKAKYFITKEKMEFIK